MRRTSRCEPNPPVLRRASQLAHGPVGHAGEIKGEDHRHTTPKILNRIFFIINILFIMKEMIRSFADAETERVFRTGQSRRLLQDILRRAAMRLWQLDAATALADLREPPLNQLEALKSDRKGQHSIRINSQWRLCFRFAERDAYDVEIADYH